MGVAGSIINITQGIGGGAENVACGIGLLERR